MYRKVLLQLEKLKKYYKAYAESGNETKKDLLYKVNGELVAHKKQPISRATLYNYIKLYEG